MFLIWFKMLIHLKASMIIIPIFHNFKDEWTLKTIFILYYWTCIVLRCNFVMSITEWGRDRAVKEQSCMLLKLRWYTKYTLQCYNFRVLNVIPITTRKKKKKSLEHWSNVVSIDRWMGKQNMVYAHNGILFRLKKERNSDTCYSMDESWEHYAE